MKNQRKLPPMNVARASASDRTLLDQYVSVRRLAIPHLKPLDHEFTVFPHKKRAGIASALKAAVKKAMAQRVCVLPPQGLEPIAEADYFAPLSFEDKRVLTVYKRALHGLRSTALDDGAVISEQARQEVIQAFTHAVHQAVLGR